MRADKLQGVITDSSGTVVAVGDFDALTPVDGGCLRTFQVDVPAGGAFYTLTVGDWTSDVTPEAEARDTGLTIIVDG
jgi:hypothetical protein